ncbi:MAG: hypothetical protein IJU93_02085, partial [Lachnospiraceae bacterium]|nr:hypothetical protein [Lachnospiraceae bacterium]
AAVQVVVYGVSSSAVDTRTLMRSAHQSVSQKHPLDVFASGAVDTRTLMRSAHQSVSQKHPLDVFASSAIIQYLGLVNFFNMC